jgi:poly(3-hydroxybutyrate) depolymerase
VQVPPGTRGDVTLLVVLHPFGGILDYLFHPWGADLGAKVARRQSPTIATYPRGHWAAWNAYNIHLHVVPWQPDTTPRVDDVGFVNAVIANTKLACAAKGIDVTQVKLIGYSNGATLAQSYLQSGAHRPSAVALIAPPPGGLFSPAFCGGAIPNPPPEALSTVAEPHLPLLVSMLMGDLDGMAGGCVSTSRWDTPFWEGDGNLYDRLWNAMGLGDTLFEGSFKYAVDTAQGQSLLAIKCRDMNHGLRTGGRANTCNGINIWDLALLTIAMP